MKPIFYNDYYFQYRMPFFDKLLEAIPEDNFDENFTWGDLCKINRVSLDAEDYRDLLLQPLHQLGSQLGIDFDAQILHPWMNVYGEGDFQEVHYHDDCDIASVIFLNDGPDFAKFYFWDSNHTAFTKPWIKIITKMKMSNIYYPEVKAGDIIMFPSHTYHGVTPHKSKEKRRTLSFNTVITNVN